MYDNDELLLLLDDDLFPVEENENVDRIQCKSQETSCR